MKTALTIAGSGSSRGADIQTDIKTMIVYGAYAMSAIMVLTTQNAIGVAGIMEVIPSFLKEQPNDTSTDIFPDVVKVGMVPSGSLIEAIGDRLAFCRAADMVVDPVMVSTSGSRLISGEAIEALKEVLPPTVNLLIPNIPEAEALLGMEIRDPGDVEKAAGAIGESHGCAILLRGGHQLSDANDLLCRHKKLKWFNGRRINDPNTRGIGCTLSSATASNLVKDVDMDLVAERTKVYLSGALEVQSDLGEESGSMNHGFTVRGEY